MHADASAAIGIDMIMDLAKVRRNDVSQLWIQDRGASGDIEISKVPGKIKIADALTKRLPAAVREYLFGNWTY